MKGAAGRMMGRLPRRLPGGPFTVCNKGAPNGLRMPQTKSRPLPYFLRPFASDEHRDWGVKARVGKADRGRAMEEEYA